MKVSKEVLREDLKELDFINESIGECGNDEHIIPNAESLALAVITIVDNYMSKHVTQGGDE